MTVQATGNVLLVSVAMPPTARCDKPKCQAQAWVEVEYPGKSDLTYCKHHYEQDEIALVLTAVRVIDHRPALYAQENGRR